MTLDFPSLDQVNQHVWSLTGSKVSAVITLPLFSEAHGEYCCYCIRGWGILFIAHNHCIYHKKTNLIRPN